MISIRNAGQIPTTLNKATAMAARVFTTGVLVLHSKIIWLCQLLYFTFHHRPGPLLSFWFVECLILEVNMNATSLLYSNRLLLSVTRYLVIRKTSVARNNCRLKRKRKLKTVIPRFIDVSMGRQNSKNNPETLQREISLEPEDRESERSQRFILTDSRML